MSTIGVKAIKYPDGDSAIDITDGGNVTLAGTLDVSGNLTVDTNTLFVDSANNRVGVGTSPSHQLHVKSSGNGKVRFEGNANTDLSDLLISHSTSGDSGLQYNSNQLNMFTYGAITFNAGTGNISGGYPANERMRITSAGNVLVGTTDAQIYDHTSGEGIVFRNGEAIDVARSGDSQITLNRMSNEGANISLHQAGTLRATIGTRGSGGFYIGTGGDNEKMRIDSAGNVGIGNTNPSTFNAAQSNNLVVGTGSGAEGITIYSGNTSQGGLAFADGTASSEHYRGLIQYDHTNNSLGLWTNTTKRVTIDSSGRVLIGTTTEGHSSGDELTIASTGSTGITVRSGTSSDGSLLFSDGTSGADEYRGYVQYNHTNNLMTFGTDGSERMRIESTGRVAIGRTSSYQSAKVTIENNAHGNYLYMGGSTENNRGLLFTSSVGSTGAAYLGAKHTILAQSGGGEMQFKNDTYTWFSLLPTGKICVNGTTTGGDMMKINNSGGSGYWALNLNNSGGSNKILITSQSGTGLVTHHQFNNSNGEVGTIKTLNSATNYNTSSDYRLKENVSYNFDATTRLKQMKPARFNFISDETNTLVDGFIAHEVSSIVPQAVMGEKDATEKYTDDNGEEQTRISPQSIDHSKLVPLLTKTLQEALARIDTLEAEVKALKG
tara:strand:+ start:1038 stop:3023 length:1986 start_codon:yes stop_codon:yes gene_type:complete